MGIGLYYRACDVTVVVDNQSDYIFFNGNRLGKVVVDRSIVPTFEFLRKYVQY